MFKARAVSMRNAAPGQIGGYGTSVIEGYRGPWLFLTTVFSFVVVLGAVCWLSLANF